MSSARIFVAGASGAIGSQVVKHLVGLGASVRVLLRNEESAKKLGDLAKSVDVVFGDLSNEEELVKATQGMNAVVSVVQGGPDVIVDGQSRLLRAAAANKVARFLPSDLSFDMRSIEDADHLFISFRRQFARAAEAIHGDTRVIHVQNGGYADVVFGFFGVWDDATSTLSYWGSEDQKLDITYSGDAAEFMAHVALDESLAHNTYANIAGDRVSFRDIKAAVEEEAGRKVTLTRRGSIEDGKAFLQKTQQEHPGNVYAWVPTQYQLPMMSGAAAFKDTLQDKYGLKTLSFRDFVKHHGLVSKWG